MNLNYNDICSMVLESVQRALNEVHSIEGIDEHLDIVNNFDTIKQIILQQWESPDDVWYINIDQRKKDRRNRGKDIKDKLNHMYGRQMGPIGYAYVQGATKEEVIESLERPTVFLFDEASQIIGKKTITSSQSFNAIKEICNKFYARAYILIHKRSQSQTSYEVGTHDIHSDNFRRGVSVSNINIRQHQWTLIDCDVDDANAQKELEDIFAKNNIRIIKKMESHNGMHYVLDKYNIPKGLFDKFNEKYGGATKNAKNDPAVLAKRDSSMLLYSPCGQF